MSKNLKYLILLSSAVIISCFFIIAFFFLLYPIKYKDTIIYYSGQYDVEPALVAAVINCESGYDDSSISNAGAIGLMQIMPNTAIYLAELLRIENFNIDMLHKPEINIMLGTYYLSILLQQFQNTKTALAAYNAGPTKVANWLKDNTYSSDGLTLLTTPYPATNA